MRRFRGKMAWECLFVWVSLLLAATFSPAFGQGPIHIQTTLHSPMITFAVNRLEHSLRAAGYFLQDSGPTVSLFLQAGEPQSFSIDRQGHEIKVTGGDERGLMYGILRLSEEVELGYSLDSVSDESHTALVAVRAFKFNLPLPGGRYLSQYNLQHNQWFWNLGYWREFLDTLAEDHYTALELWSAEPWSQMVNVPKYPEATTLTPEEMRQHIHFFRTLLRMAKDRGIDTFLITWNIDLSRSFAEAHHIPPINVDSSLVRDYLRDSIRTVLTTYPELTGLGTTQGEQMGVIPPDKRADWIADVYFRAIRESGRRRVPFILRYWGGAPADTERAVAAYGLGPVYLDIKYNGEHVYSSPMYHVQDSSWLSQTHHYKLLWHLRNDDLYAFRWGNPEFVRELMQNLRRTDAAGFTYGSEIDIPGPDDFDTPAAAAHQRWKYEFQKQWFAFALWGRLGYNPDLPDTLWRAYFRLHDGPAGDALYDSTVAASHLAPLITSFHWNYMDGDWYVEGSIGSWNTSAEVPRINYRRFELYHNILGYVFNNAIDSGYENFPEYVAQMLSHWNPPDAIRSPLDVAQEAETEGRVALLAASIPDPGGRFADEFQAAQSDDEAYGHLALYYAEKIRGAADLSLFLFSGNAQDKVNAIAHLKRALDQWKDLVAVAERHYVPRDIWMMGGFSWGKYTSDVQRDLEIASTAQTFPSGSQVWQVASTGNGIPSFQNVSTRTYGPFVAAGFHSWLLYEASLVNWDTIEAMAGRRATYVWRRALAAQPGRVWVLETPSTVTAKVKMNGQTITPLVSAAPDNGGNVSLAHGYKLYPLGASGMVEAMLGAGVVPEATAVAAPSSIRVELRGSQAANVRPPLEKTSSGVLQAPMLGLPPAHPLNFLSTEVYKAASATYEVRLTQPGFYKIRCQLLAPRGEDPVVPFSFDGSSQRGNQLSGRSSADWQWASNRRGIPLGAGIHTLTIYVRDPGEQIKAIEVESVE